MLYIWFISIAILAFGIYTKFTIFIVMGAIFLGTSIVATFVVNSGILGDIANIIWYLWKKMWLIIFIVFAAGAIFALLRGILF